GHYGVPLAVLLTVVGTPALATDWQQEFTPYLWASGMDGTVGAGPVRADVDRSGRRLRGHRQRHAGRWSAVRGPDDEPEGGWVAWRDDTPRRPRVGRSGARPGALDSARRAVVVLRAHRRRRLGTGPR